MVDVLVEMFYPGKTKMTIELNQVDAGKVRRILAGAKRKQQPVRFQSDDGKQVDFPKGFIDFKVRVR
jgi:hypothetical protein